VTADTSAVIAALSSWHEQHESADAALAAVRRLPAHVALEAYSVLTRLPGGLAVGANDAARVLTERFPDPPLRLGDDARAALVDVLAAAGVQGGGAYDGLVGLEAKAHGETLLTLDARALRAYQRLGVDYQVISGGKGRGRGGGGGGEASGGTGVREPRRQKPGGEADAVEVEPEETEKRSPKQKPRSRGAPHA
jgi:predicted nucleic acid-binding protein